MKNILSYQAVILGLLAPFLSVWASTVELQTNKGPIIIELDEKKAPKTSANFLEYVKKGHYNGLIFHRVINDFMIQGGGFDTKLQEKKTGAPITNEADNGLQNLKGTIAMARTSDPHSASAQFFINVNDNNFLDHRSKDSNGWGYAVFGRITKGMDVVNQIKMSPTGTRNGLKDVPVNDIVIEKAIIR